VSASIRDHRWAKAPDFAGQPARLEAIAAQTVEDKHEYLDSGLQEVDCKACGACVLVRKNTYKHTSIQWTSDPALRCHTFKDAIASGQTSALKDGCPQLHDSIADAVRDGTISVRDPETS
jgi:hypothetical protein